MPEVSDEENELTVEQTEDITEDVEENDDENNSEDEEKNEGVEENEEDDENEDEESEGGEENEDDEENKDEEDGEGEEENEDGEVTSIPDDIEINENDSTHEVVKKLTMKEKFNDMERKKILIASLIFSLMISLPSGLGIGLGTAPLPDYCAYPKFKPCRTHGECSMHGSIPSCECDKGWQGELCQLQNCDHEDACVDENTLECSFSKSAGVTCHCKDGYDGRQCNDVRQCTKGEYADCNGHGNCSISDDLPKCSCDEGWMGTTCRMKSCDHKNTCVAGQFTDCYEDSKRGAVCQCKEGFKGFDCSTQVQIG